MWSIISIIVIIVVATALAWKDRKKTWDRVSYHATKVYRKLFRIFGD